MRPRAIGDVSPRPRIKADPEDCRGGMAVIPDMAPENNTAVPPAERDRLFALDRVPEGAAKFP